MYYRLLYLYPHIAPSVSSFPSPLQPPVVWPVWEWRRPCVPRVTTRALARLAGSLDSLTMARTHSFQSYQKPRQF